MIRKKRTITGWIFPCELNDFRQSIFFQLPGARYKVFKCDCKCAFACHDPIKVSVTIKRLGE